MYRIVVANCLLILTFCLLFAGCAQPSLKMQVDGLAPEEISIIKTENKKISIVGVDGQKSVGFMSFMLHDGQWAGEASLRPGKHEFNIMYDDGHIKSLYLYNLVTHGGSSYMIKHQIVNKSIFLWFEDLNTEKPVGKVLASTNEPITDKNIILDHSVYFTMESPQEDGWIIAYRNTGQTAFAKEGSNTDETYGTNVILFELPVLNSREEFINFVKEGRKKATDSKRFNITKDELEYFDGREDYCVSYHSVAEDSEAVKRSRNKDIMILEMVGYLCRHPQNKNIGINFDYSQRYYPGHQDENLTTKAHGTFKSLKF